MRRVITGVGPDGRSTVVSDGPPEASYRFAGPRADPNAPRRAGLDADEGEFILAVLWTTEGTPRADDPDPVDPDAPINVAYDPGAMKWRLAIFGPNRETPMHTTPTLDCIAVLSGEIDLILETETVHLVQGDTFVLPGTAHGWRTGAARATLSIHMTGLARDDA